MILNFIYTKKELEKYLRIKNKVYIFAISKQTNITNYSTWNKVFEEVTNIFEGFIDPLYIVNCEL